MQNITIEPTITFVRPRPERPQEWSYGIVKVDGVGKEIFIPIGDTPSLESAHERAWILAHFGNDLISDEPRKTTPNMLRRDGRNRISRRRDAAMMNKS